MVSGEEQRDPPNFSGRREPATSTKDTVPEKDSRIVFYSQISMVATQKLG